MADNRPSKPEFLVKIREIINRRVEQTLRDVAEVYELQFLMAPPHDDRHVPVLNAVAIQTGEENADNNRDVPVATVPQMVKAEVLPTADNTAAAANVPINDVAVVPNQSNQVPINGVKREVQEIVIKVDTSSEVPLSGPSPSTSSVKGEVNAVSMPPESAALEDKFVGGVLKRDPFENAAAITIDDSDNDDGSADTVKLEHCSAHTAHVADATALDIAGPQQAGASRVVLRQFFAELMEPFTSDTGGAIVGDGNHSSRVEGNNNCQCRNTAFKNKVK